MSHYNTRQWGHSKPPHFGDHKFVGGVRGREPDDFDIHKSGFPPSGKDIGFGNLRDAFARYDPQAARRGEGAPERI